MCAAEAEPRTIFLTCHQRCTAGVIIQIAMSTLPTVRRFCTNTKTGNRMNVETVPLVYEANDECCASFGGGRIANTNNGANSKVHYFLIDHSGCKRVVAKGMPMSRIYLDHQITIPSAKLGNNCCTSSGSGNGPWYPCPTMPISGYGSTINNLRSRLRCAVRLWSFSIQIVRFRS